MLRLQRSDHTDPWRATLENAHTGEVLRFANEMALLQHLFLALNQPGEENGKKQKGLEIGD